MPDSTDTYVCASVNGTAKRNTACATHRLPVPHEMPTVERPVAMESLCTAPPRTCGTATPSMKVGSSAFAFKHRFNECRSVFDAARGFQASGQFHNRPLLPVTEQPRDEQLGFGELA